MRLTDWDWNAQKFVERDYPDEPIAEFINWLRTTKQWYQSPDPGRDVYTRYLKLQDQLTQHRNRPVPPPVPVIELAPPPRASRRRKA